MTSNMHSTILVAALFICAIVCATTEGASTRTTNVEPTTVSPSKATTVSTPAKSGPDNLTTGTPTPSTTAVPTTVSPTTTQPPTTGSPVTPPYCKDVGKGQYPAKYCNQYYECLERRRLFRTEYKRVLRACSDDLIFDVSSERCVVGTCSPKSVAPDCRQTGKGKFPAENSREYYECSVFRWPIFLFKDYDLILKACKPDEVFDAHKEKCVKDNSKWCP